jgi:diketogulonate reductase-like aldo/keto reductase
MELKRLGASDERIPEIGLGTWQYKGGSPPLRAGIALGATLIDTAERYGTEDAVGEAISGLRKRVFVATKVRHENLRHADVLRAAENSLRRLRIERIDLYQVHRPNPEVPIAETMRALDELVDAGKVRFIGVSNFSIAQFEEAQGLTKNRIVSNQVRYSLVDRSVERDMLPYCQKNDVTLIAYSPLARGMDKIRDAGRDATLAEIAAAEGRAEAQVALNWCTARDNVVAIPRGSTIAHVEDICGASGWRLSASAIERLDAAYSEKSA